MVHFLSFDVHPLLLELLSSLRKVWTSEATCSFSVRANRCPPLMIASTISELIDALLVNDEPFGDSQFLPHELIERADIVSLAAHMYPPGCSATQTR